LATEVKEISSIKMWRKSGMSPSEREGGRIEGWGERKKLKIKQKKYEATPPRQTDRSSHPTQRLT
jgi:hypothetical protein